MTEIQLVVWDVDRVWYSDISTTYGAKGNPNPHDPYLKTVLYDLKSCTYDQISLWKEKSGRSVESVGDVADMLTDLFYGLKKGEEFLIPKGTITKDQIIQGKQSLLKGLTLGQVKRIADSVNYTDGLLHAIGIIHGADRHGIDIKQVGFSDGLGPFVAYKMMQTGVEIGGIVPAVLDRYGKEIVFDESSANDLMEKGEAVLTGKTLPFKKTDAAFEYIASEGLDLKQIAAIDDSAANISMLKKVQDGGGLAFGFRVNDEKAFREAGIPILKGGSLEGFAEIVLDPSLVDKYCSR